MKLALYKILAVLALSLPTTCLPVPLPEEKPLWPDAYDNPIRYKVPEAMRQNAAAKTAPSAQNRVYSYVSKPTYAIHDPEPGTGTGLGLVICPGGGFRELWLDREGHDLALWLKYKGITSLVLKYRTNTESPEEKTKYPPEVYLPAVVADAHQAIRILRLHLSTTARPAAKVGICGFSAGGALAMYSVFQPESKTGENGPSSQPDFAGLFYPGLRGADPQLVTGAKQIPPLFIINAIDDSLTPIGPCVDFYQVLLKAGARAELHLYNQGGHGFDMGTGHGESVGLWKESFVAWLQDNGWLRASPHHQP